jgi:hypothetical protein
MNSGPLLLFGEKPRSSGAPQLGISSMRAK